MSNSTLKLLQFKMCFTVANKFFTNRFVYPKVEHSAHNHMQQGNRYHSFAILQVFVKRKKQHTKVCNCLAENPKCVFAIA